jgi:Rap guanine nucleotide exchange factor 2
MSKFAFFFQPPLIPIYPMVSKDLTFIHLGNETKVEGLINFEKLRMIAKEVRSLMNMCSANLDLFTVMEARQGAECSQAIKSMNTIATMKRGSNVNTQHRKGKETLNAKKMHEEVRVLKNKKFIPRIWLKSSSTLH